LGRVSGFTFETAVCRLRVDSQAEKKEMPRSSPAMGTGRNAHLLTKRE